MIRPRACYIFAAALFVILFTPVSKYVWDSLYYTGIIQRPVNPREITIVTMYVNIGKFQKGGGNNYFTPDTYKNWMKTWGWLSNRVVAFFDSDMDLETFREIRSLQPEDRSILIKVNRGDLPAFRSLKTVTRIFQSPGYPKHAPNTVVPEYACAMSAKYDALDMAMDKGLVHSKYLAWMDIGLFRNLQYPQMQSIGKKFTLEVPENFNSSCVSMSEVAHRAQMSKLTPKDYIWGNHVWVAGGFIVGTTKVVKEFSQAYKNMATHMMDENLTSTDQQIIGAMYSPDYIQKQPVDVNSYKCKDGQFGLGGSDIQYFCLPYICREAGEKSRNGSLVA